MKTQQSEYLDQLSAQVELESKLFPGIADELNWVRRDFELLVAQGKDTTLGYIEARANLDRIRMEGMKRALTKTRKKVDYSLESTTLGATHKLTDATEELEVFYSCDVYSDCPLFEKVELDGRVVDPADYNISYNELQLACEEDCNDKVESFRYGQRGGE